MKMGLKSKISIKLKDKIDSLTAHDALYNFLDHYEIINMPIDKLHWKVWKRPYGPHGYRLTEFGYMSMDNILKIQCWKIPLTITNKRINSQDILRLDRYLTSPFFISAKYNPKSKENPYTFFTFDESIASQLLLYGSDLKYYLQALDS